MVARPPGPAWTRDGYRADIDGLRAVAVLGVLAFHAFPQGLPGGFVGVDVFFVISGFLITRIIVRARDAGAFSFGEFYARRIRRIFPALAIVLAACQALGYFALLGDELRQLGKHVASGAGFVSNLVLWSEAGYFAEAAEGKPLLHLWSLGIEEQFYLAFPLLLWCLHRWHVRLPRALALLAGGSFCWNLVTASGDPVAGFFSPATRFWELAAGALLACPGDRSGPGLPGGSVAGTALIAAAMLGFDRDVVYPGWRALLPAAGACLVIAAPTGAWLNRRVLGHPLLVWVGLCSFPLYLWHWPLLSFARIVESGLPPWRIRLAIVLLSLLLAWLTHRFIESPLRLGGQGRLKVALLCLAMAAIGWLGFDTYEQGWRAARFGDRVLDPSVSEPRMLRDAACVRTHAGVFEPGFEDSRDFCLVNEGDPSRGLFVIGDSHANRLYHGLLAVAGDRLLVNLGRGTCLPLLGGPRDGRESDDRGCRPTMARILEQAIRSRAATIVVTAYFSQYLGQGQPPPRREMEEALRALDRSGKKVVLVLDVPKLPFDPGLCKLRPFRLREPPPCRFPRSVHEQARATYLAILTPMIEDLASVSLLDPSDIFCDADHCRGADGSSLLYRDDNHVNAEGARRMARALLDLAR